MKDSTSNLVEALNERARETTAMTEHVATPPGKPVELDRLQEICCGDKEFERELIEVFLSDSLERIQTMESALNEKNVEVFRIQAHSIKGASANAGAETMTSIARSMEKAETDGEDHEVQQLLKEMKQEYENVRRFLTHYLETEIPPMESSP